MGVRQVAAPYAEFDGEDAGPTLLPGLGASSLLRIASWNVKYVRGTGNSQSQVRAPRRPAHCGTAPSPTKAGLPRLTRPSELRPRISSPSFVRRISACRAS